jgi:hypothetical protein
VNIAEPVTLAGAGSAAYGTLYNLTGDNSLAATSLTLAADTDARVIAADAAGSLTLADLSAGSVRTLRKEGPGALTLNFNLPMSGAATVHEGALRVASGKTLTSSRVTVETAAVLGGSGTIAAAVQVQGGTVSPGPVSAPGTGQGALAVGATTFTGGAFQVDLNGGTAGTGYDQLVVAGQVALGNATLNLTRDAAFTPVVTTPATEFVLIDTTGGATGTFAGLPEGSVIQVGGLAFKISYVGGADHKDVVLVRTPVAVDYVVHDVGLAGTDDDSQRSMITRLEVHFRGKVASLQNGAFTLTRSDGGTVDLAWTLHDVGDSSVAELRFTGGTATYRAGAAYALNDGKYHLVVDGRYVKDNTNSDGANGADDFFRLFGDSDGDALVDSLDMYHIRQAMGTNARNAAQRAMFDYDGDRDVDSADYRQFRLRYGQRLA